MRRAERDRQPLAIEHRIDGERSVTEVTIYTLDTHGLFARLAGAMAISGANIVDAKIFTLANGMALDTFWIQDLEGKPFDGPQRLARLAARVELSLSNRLDIQRELDSQRSSWPKRDRVFTVEPRVLIDNNASDTFTVIEVNGRDRPGFLHVVTRALTRLNLQIASAHITTYGERAVDVFYVKDLFGLKVVHQDKLKQIADTVEKSIRDFDAQVRADGKGGGIVLACRLLHRWERATPVALMSSGPRASRSLMSKPEARGPKEHEKMRHWSGALPAKRYSGL